MKLLSKKDLIFAIITGLSAGLIAFVILNYLKIKAPIVPNYGLIFIVPITWILGVQLGYFLGAYLSFFDQFGKFVAIGFTNFAVDAGILNILIAVTGLAVGLWFSVFKMISFIVAVTHSYFWNRSWTFQSSGQTAREYSKFMIVTIAAAFLNVAAASGVVNFIPAPSGIGPEIWANIGAVIGSATALVFSFLGFRIFVFKKI